jgi:hypothetical protein
LSATKQRERERRRKRESVCGVIREGRTARLLLRSEEGKLHSSSGQCDGDATGLGRMINPPWENE